MRSVTPLLLFAIIPLSGIQAGTLGRLFFTPEQRVQLEASQARNASGEIPSSELILNGIVQTGDGARTVWINSKAVKLNRRGKPEAEAVALPGKSQTVEIRVGQKLRLDTFAPQSSPVSAE